MPNIDDIMKEKREKKKFVKKEYRPWNIGELVNTDTPDNQDKEPQNLEKSEAQGEPPHKDNPVKHEDVNRNRAIVTVAPAPEKNISSNATEKLNPKEEILVLSGLQKELFKLILGSTDTETMCTNAILAKELVELLSTSLPTIKNTITKLEKKSLIKSLSKRGRGGFYKFRVDVGIYNFGVKNLT